MSARRKKTEAELGFESLFEHALPGLPGGNAIQEARRKAMAAFASAGLPGRGNEHWHYTNLRQMLTDVLPLARPGRPVAPTPTDAATHALAGLDCAVMAFVDGFFRPELSDLTGLGDGVHIAPLSGALARDNSDILVTDKDDDDPLVHLNSAFATDGAVIRLETGVKAARPLHLLHLGSAAEASSSFQRVRIDLADGADLTLLETHAGGNGFSNRVTQMTLATGARLHRIRLQNEGMNAQYFSHSATRLSESARLDDFVFSMGAGLARSQASVRFTGENAHAALAGATLIGDHQHHDITLTIKHSAPGCTSTEAFRSVIDGEARGIFQGQIIVDPGAQKTDARMKSDGLLLSDTAEFDTKPELEIYADDVQCAHGATSGELDAEALFFLRARGIPLPRARALLISAFIDSVLAGVQDEAIRACLEQVAQSWLEEHRS